MPHMQRFVRRGCVCFVWHESTLWVSVDQAYRLTTMLTLWLVYKMNEAKVVASLCCRLQHRSMGNLLQPSYS